MSHWKKIVLSVFTVAGALFLSAALMPPAEVHAQQKNQDPYEKGKTLLHDLHCYDCHLLPGAEKHAHVLPGGLRLLPSLDFEGDRARPEWVFEFLKKPFHLRPELKAKMPDFALTDQEAMALTDFLMTRKLKQEVYAPEDLPSVLGPHDPETLKQAKDAFFLYKCYQCHLLEGKVLDPEKGMSGPDFIHVYNRLKVKWNYQWLVDPQAFIPGTKMPNFFYSDGEELIDDPEQDMFYILVYMYSLGEHKDYEEFKKLREKYPPAPEQGEKLAKELHCTGCHEFQGWEKLDLVKLAQEDQRLDLRKAGARRSAAWISEHLKTPPSNPRDQSKGHVPGFNISQEEIQAMAEYLATLK